MKYWVVGAMWGGKDDVLPQFIKRGYWYCWDVNTTMQTAMHKGTQSRFNKSDFAQSHQVTALQSRKCSDKALNRPGFCGGRLV